MLCVSLMRDEKTRHALWEAITPNVTFGALVYF
jgi:hypothetical protein